MCDSKIFAKQDKFKSCYLAVSEFDQANPYLFLGRFDTFPCRSEPRFTICQNPVDITNLGLQLPGEINISLLLADHLRIESVLLP